MPSPSLLKQIDGMRIRRLSSTIKGDQYVKFRKVLKFVPEVLIFRHAEAAPVRILCLREARGFVDLFRMIRVK